MPRVRFGPVSMAIFLIAPVAVVAVIVWIIIASLGIHSEGVEARGAGAGDTGGANAIGEMLAGDNTDREQRDTARAGGDELRDPWGWPAGITVIVHDRGLNLSSEDTGVRPELILWPGPGTPPSAWIRVPFEPRQGGTWAATIGPDRIDAFRSLAQSTEGGGAMVVGVGEVRAVDGQLVGPGGPLRRFTLERVPAPDADSEQPLPVRFDFASVYR